MKFYSDSKDKIIWIKQNYNSGNNFGIIFSIFIILILVGAFLFYRNQKKKNIEYDYKWMEPNDGINSKFNNINQNV